MSVSRSLRKSKILDAILDDRTSASHEPGGAKATLLLLLLEGGAFPRGLTATILLSHGSLLSFLNAVLA